MTQININETALQPVGEALLQLVDAEDELLQALFKLQNEVITANFQGGAVAGIDICLEELTKRINATIADSIQKNYDDFEALQRTFNEMDVNLKNYLNISNYHTSDFSTELDYTVTGDDVHSNLKHTGGSQYQRRE